MFLPIPKSTYCELDDASIITPYRRPNHLRNQSLPNFRFQSRGPKTQPFQHLKYNKWYIKPEKRLKDSLVHNSCDQLRSFSKYRLMTEQDFVYEGLYKTSQNTKRLQPAKPTFRSSEGGCVERLCSDNSNIKVLTRYKQKKEQTNKRVPGVIHYLIKYNLMQQKQRKNTILKKTRIRA